MKLRTAKIKNFKLLKDLKLEFGSARDKPLTVVRAENASGKTSLLNALRWGLFGLKGLERNDVRLSPADWPDHRPCEIEVQVQFDHTVYMPVGRDVVARPVSYRLVRAVTETPNRTSFERSSERVSLYELTATGASPSQSAEATVAKIIPLEMKDIFFTDGDAALSFISSGGNRGARRQQVKEAIRSLLGVALLEDAQKHLKAAQSAFRARVAALGGSGDLTIVQRELDAENARVEEAESKLREANTRVKNLERQYEEADKGLIRALQEGNFEELSARLDKANRQRERGAELEARLKRDQQRVFEAESLSWALLRPALEDASSMLAELRDKGVIPKTTIPVLQDRLAMGICICGTSLAPGSPGRDHVEQLIATQRATDEEKQRLTRLYYEARGSSDSEAAPGAWIEALDSVERNRVQMMRLQEEATKEAAWCEQRIKSIDKEEIEQKRTLRETVHSNLMKQNKVVQETEIALDQAGKRVKALNERFRELAARSKQDATAKARLEVATDAYEAITEALCTVQGECVERVSKRMNALFLDMIGADPDQGGLFGEARITDSYDITVKTRDGKVLDPEFELNGASKRALTFSFVWALTEVSGVAAPRIIDTPLGMMSGSVKRRVLELISAPNEADSEKQVMLLLTRAEIAGTESVLDQVTGRSMTFTNTIHYPKDLRNEPPLLQPTVIQCECNYRQVCKVCSRYDDDLYALSAREA